MDDRQNDALTYVYKPSLTGAARTFELGDEGLSFRTGTRAGTWRYQEIASIRLSYRPISMLSRRFRTDIRHIDGKSLTLVSATWMSIAVVSPQDDAYRRFVEALHRRLQSSNGSTTYFAGLKPWIYWLAVGMLALVMLALAGLLIRAMATGSATAAVFMLGFAAWFGWSIGRWLLFNRPGHYDPSMLPRNLMP